MKTFTIPYDIPVFQSTKLNCLKYVPSIVTKQTAKVKFAIPRACFSLSNKRLKIVYVCTKYSSKPIETFLEYLKR